MVSSEAICRFDKPRDQSENLDLAPRQAGRPLPVAVVPAAPRAEDSGHSIPVETPGAHLGPHLFCRLIPCHGGAVGPWLEPGVIAIGRGQKPPAGSDLATRAANPSYVVRPKRMPSIDPNIVST